MRSHILALTFLLGGSAVACAQWTIQDSHTTADLHSIDSAGNGIAWASGSNGVILRTQNEGQSWENCAPPSTTGHDDFRAIQAIDAETAIVMSSGKGHLSKIYKTTDGCKTWKLAFENPDDMGSFANLRRISKTQFYLLGQPVDGKFAVFLSQDGGENWFATDDPGLDSATGQLVSAESNSAMYSEAAALYFGTVGVGQPDVYFTYPKCDKTKPGSPCSVAWGKTEIPIAAGTPVSGVSSIAFRAQLNLGTGAVIIIGAVVGGNADKPEDASATAAYTADGKIWQPAKTMPGGYRSAVAYNRAAGLWIAVGPNGTDESNDDGKNWHALKPGPQNSPDADKNWTALSLPFVVGPHGRIGKLKSKP